MLGATSIVKNSNKEKWVYCGYGITFDGAGSWNFGNDFPRNVIIFGVDSSSLCYTDNCKNNFFQLLVLMETLFHQRKNLVLISVRQRQNFTRVCIIMVVIVICLLMEKNI